MKTIENEILVFDEVVSTQELAMKYIRERKTTHGLVLTAKKQTGGQGRLERSWSSPIGGLWMTTIYQCKTPLTQFEGFSIRLGLELIKGLESSFPLDFQIKWPNDLIVKKKKVGGILINTRIKEDILTELIIGIGINVNNKTETLPPEVASIATSMSENLREKISIDSVQDIVLIAQNRLFQKVVRNELEDIGTNWPKKSFSYQKEIRVVTREDTLTGLEQGITENGELILKTNSNELKTISIGDIELLRMK